MQELAALAEAERAALATERAAAEVQSAFVRLHCSQFALLFWR